nr:DIE2/ALG10 family [Tanacetum cinerariifolium]
MGYRRSVQDEVLKVSTTVFIKNFPDQAGTKELWNACKQYEHVVDAFIPNRRSKIGIRFGFVRFIKVFDAERLVNNLCTVWIGSHRLHASIARFQRPTGQNSSRNFGHNWEKWKDDKGNNGNFNSYAHVLKGVSHPNGDTMNTPSLVIGDDCQSGRLFALSQWKVFRSVDGKDKFKVNVGTNSWFSLLIETSSDFVVDGRVAWVEVEGIPLKVWTDNTFKRIASKWGTLLSIDNSEEDCYHNKCMCIFTADMVNIFESFKIIYQGKTFWIRAKEVSGWSLEFEEQLDEDSEPEDDIFGGVDKPNIDNSKEEFEDENVVPDTVFDDGSVKPSVVKNSSGNQGNKSEDPFDLYPLLNKNKGEKIKIPIVEVIYKRLEIVNSINELDKQQAMETAQKAKIKLAIKDLVKKEFLNHFKNTFGRPNTTRPVLVTEFPRQLNSMQRIDMEADVTIEEIKNTVWDCRTDKSPRPDGFLFHFY